MTVFASGRFPSIARSRRSRLPPERRAGGVRKRASREESGEAPGSRFAAEESDRERKGREKKKRKTPPRSRPNTEWISRISGRFRARGRLCVPGEIMRRRVLIATMLPGRIGLLADAHSKIRRASTCRGMPPLRRVAHDDDDGDDDNGSPAVLEVRSASARQMFPGSRFPIPRLYATRV